MTEIELSKRVAEGALLLDRLSPDWHLRVASDRLAMETCDRCVLGQIYGDYWIGCQRLASRLPSDFLFSSAEHGFTLPDEMQPNWSVRVMSRFADLARLWRAEIAKRLEDR